VNFANQSGRILLRSVTSENVDVLAYGKSPPETTGWHGAPATLYTRGTAAASGQLYHRKLDPSTDRPLDSDTAADWAGDLADPTWGRRVRQPGWQGWDAASLLRPFTAREHARVTLAVGPEGLYELIAAALHDARLSVDLNIYTLEHPQLAAELAEAARRGVRVRILLEGGPPGGITPLQRWCVAQVAAAGGDVRYFAVQPTAPNGYRKRYRFAHAKFAVIDRTLGLVGTENFNPDSMPVPGAAPAGGRRGFYLITDAPGVVAHLARLFAVDWAPDVFRDLRPFALEDPKLGGPPADFMLPPPPEYPVAAAPFSTPTTAEDDIRFMVVSAPENALRPDAGINQLIAETGTGDEILVFGLYENRHWGEVASNPIADPNPRLEALLAAARRGAQVRLLLDSFFDEEDALRSNRATAEYVRAIAAAEGLNLEARLGNPTLGGIHAKALLVRVGSERWTAIGSLNGGEVSTKLNREVVLLVDARPIFDRVRTVFEHDWALSQ
jgi:phosphatidylserine/phosphatidylglycerophosphate/cardiolipin synthase-like enzyme